MSSRTSATPLHFTAQLVTDVNAALADCADFGEQCPARLGQAIRYSLLSPGKRLRPLLVLLSAEACGSSTVAAMPAACAVEMIHAYSLIHDDLPAMDDDDLRRGRPTCHIQFDEATAILAGDALLTQAFGVLASADWPHEVAVACCCELAKAAGYAGMVGGQADDLSAEHQAEADINFLESIHRRKTGAMIRVSLRLGAIVARADSQQQAALEAYGERLGLAFQIIDDLLDFAGNEEELGKRVQKDAERGKLTFPGLLGTETAQARAVELVESSCERLEMFGSDASRLKALARYVLERKN